MGEKCIEQVSGDINAAFWLPPHFLTDDDFLPHNHNHHTSGFGLDPFDSPLTDKAYHPTHHELLSELTRHLAHASFSDHQDGVKKARGISTSPQSIITGFEPWKSNRTGFTSNGNLNGPSITPDMKNDAAWDILHEAGNQVARLKLKAIAAQMREHNNRNGVLPVPRQHSSLYDIPDEWAQQERQTWLCKHHRPPVATRQQNEMFRRSMYVGGGGGKRESKGTGVFLPRRVPRQHHHAPAEPALQKPTGLMLPARVVKAINHDLDDSPHSSFVSGFTHHEIMMARRNAIISEERRNMRRENAATRMGHDIRLPTDWTYY